MTTFPAPLIPNPTSYGIPESEFPMNYQGNKKVLLFLQKRGYPVSAINEIKALIARNKANSRLFQATARWLRTVLYSAPVTEVKAEVKPVERKVLRTGQTWYEKKREIEYAAKPLPAQYASASDMAKFASESEIEDYISPTIKTH